MHTPRAAAFPATGVTHEWARLREVIVGRPYYRIAKPFPEHLKEGIGESSWNKIKAQEGRPLSEAFPPVYERARKHMARAADLLRRRGIGVRELPPLLPDEEPGPASGGIGAMQCFPRDPLLVAGEKVFELALCDARRRRELLPLRRLLDSIPEVGTRIADTMPDALSPDAPAREGARLEGGDCLLLGNEMLVGISGFGSTPEGVEWLRGALGGDRRVTAVALDPAFPHLDLALGLVRPGLGIRCPAAFPEGLPASLDGWEWLDVTPEEALRQMAANCLPLDARTTVLPEEAARVAELLATKGQEVLTTPFKGVAWMGGGLRCWTQPLARCD